MSIFKVHEMSNILNIFDTYRISVVLFQLNGEYCGCPKLHQSASIFYLIILHILNSKVTFIEFFYDGRRINGIRYCLHHFGRNNFVEKAKKNSRILGK